jgi:hypothetical protein
MARDFRISIACSGVGAMSETFTKRQDPAGL